jgi:hypothetical protein
MHEVVLTFGPPYFYDFSEKKFGLGVAPVFFTFISTIQGAVLD